MNHKLNVVGLHSAKGTGSPAFKYDKWNIKIPSQLVCFILLCFTVNPSRECLISAQDFSGQKPHRTAAIITCWMSAKVTGSNKSTDSRRLRISF